MSAKATARTRNKGLCPETRRIDSPAPLLKEEWNQQLTNMRDSNVTNNTAVGNRSKRLLRTREAAEYLSVSSWKLRKLVQDGMLPIVQDSDRAAWRVDLRDLDAFIERNKRLSPM